MAQPQEFEQVTYNDNDGAQMGRTSSTPIAFYGATPVARLAATTLDVSTTSTVSAGGAVTTWAFATQAEINNLVAAVSTLQSQAKRMGLIAT